MIQRLNAPSFAFKAKSSVTGAKDAYEHQIAENSRIAQEQNNKLNVAMTTNKSTGRIAMQGSGEKLDIMA